MPENLRPLGFHLLIKPTGAMCNLGCRYCYYLSKERLYPGSRFCMTNQLLEATIQQVAAAHRINDVQIGWQGGEPTLMGLDFFQTACDWQKTYARPEMIFHNSIQTNGVLLNDEWGEFFSRHHFLVGLSLDGPEDIHNAYRVDKKGRPTFERVMRGLGYLQKHGVNVNILTTLHAANAERPLDVYRFLRDEVGARFIQFIPIVDQRKHRKKGSPATPYSIRAKAYGRFMIDIFDEWVRRDVGKVFVQLFDVALAKWVGAPSSLCAYSPTCGGAIVLEHNGDVYTCDHFVSPAYFIGNIMQKPLKDMVNSWALWQFGRDKREKLPMYCRQCDVLFACHGECPKNRFIKTPDGEAGLNYLCSGLKDFFHHIDPPMRMMADLLNRGRAPAEVMNTISKAN